MNAENTCDDDQQAFIINQGGEALTPENWTLIIAGACLALCVICILFYLYCKNRNLEKVHRLDEFGMAAAAQPTDTFEGTGVKLDTPGYVPQSSGEKFQGGAMITSTSSDGYETKFTSDNEDLYSKEGTETTVPNFGMLLVDEYGESQTRINVSANPIRKNSLEDLDGLYDAREGTASSKVDGKRSPRDVAEFSNQDYSSLYTDDGVIVNAQSRRLDQLQEGSTSTMPEIALVDMGTSGSTLPASPVMSPVPQPQETPGLEYLMN